MTDAFRTSALLLLIAATQLTAADTDMDATKAIRKVLDDQSAAWNRGDLQGFMKGYWNSEKLSFTSGNTTTRGWEPTLERYQKRYQGEGKEMGKLTFSDLEIELLSPSIAFVRGRFTLVTSTGKPAGLFTLILKNLPEGWKIIHDHTSG